VTPSDPTDPDGAASGGPSGDPWAPHFPDEERSQETQESIGRLRNGAPEKGEKTDARRSFWKELPFLVLVALVVAIIIKTFLIQAFFIPSASMASTLVEGDRVMVNKLSYRFGDPSRGDVIVFDDPTEPNTDGESLLGALIRHVAESLGLSSPDSALIKRVVAVGGESIEVRDNAVLIDGVPVDEPYLDPDIRMGGDFGPEVVPDGHVFVMGDNRGSSQDSRRFGAIPVDDIIGRAFVKVWPPSRWGGL
jgi:signal peptidase I